MNRLIDHPAKIVSWVTLISMLAIAAYTVIDTSKVVAENSTNIKGITEYIAEQRIANKLMQEMQQQPYRNQRQQPPPYEPPPRDCWDDYYQEWYDCSEDYR